MAGKINLDIYGPDRVAVFELGIPPLKVSEYAKYKKAQSLVQTGADKDGKGASYIARILGRTAELIGIKDPNEGTGSTEGGKE